jgi:hypothetical protein
MKPSKTRIFINEQEIIICFIGNTGFLIAKKIIQNVIKVCILHFWKRPAVTD